MCACVRAVADDRLDFLYFSALFDIHVTAGQSTYLPARTRNAPPPRMMADLSVQCRTGRHASAYAAESPAVSRQRGSRWHGEFVNEHANRNVHECGFRILSDFSRFERKNGSTNQHSARHTTSLQNRLLRGTVQFRGTHTRTRRYGTDVAAGRETLYRRPDQLCNRISPHIVFGAGDRCAMIPPAQQSVSAIL